MKHETPHGHGHGHGHGLFIPPTRREVQDQIWADMRKQEGREMEENAQALMYQVVKSVFSRMRASVFMHRSYGVWHGAVSRRRAVGIS
jgi:hypothetical protein